MTEGKRQINENAELHEGLVFDQKSLHDWEYSPEDDDLVADERAYEGERHDEPIR